MHSTCAFNTGHLLRCLLEKALVSDCNRVADDVPGEAVLRGRASVSSVAKPQTARESFTPRRFAKDLINRRGSSRGRGEVSKETMAVCTGKCAALEKKKTSGRVTGGRMLQLASDVVDQICQTIQL